MAFLGGLSAALGPGLAVPYVAAVFCSVLMLLLVWLVLAPALFSVMHIPLRAISLSSLFLPDPVLSLSEVDRILVSVFLSGPLPVPVLVDVSASPLHVLVGFGPEFSLSAPSPAHSFPLSPSASLFFLVEGVVSPVLLLASLFPVALSVPVPFSCSCPHLFVSGDLGLLLSVADMVWSCCTSSSEVVASSVGIVGEIIGPIVCAWGVAWFHLHVRKYFRVTLRWSAM